MGKIIYNGQHSDLMGLLISGVDNYGAPERIVTEYQIPGANGTYVVDSGAYGNKTRVYNAAIYRERDMEGRMATIKRWLLPDGDYHRLEDSYAPDVYRMARCTGGLSTEGIGPNLRNIKFPITFSCRPEKFLKSGESPVTVSPIGAVTSLANPTGFPATPMLSIRPESTTDSIQIVFRRENTIYGTVTVTAPSTVRTILIDCETTEAWFDDAPGESANQLVEISGRPVLNEDMTRVSRELPAPLQSSGAQISITPRWWRL